jgi:hypothetical protein
MILMAAGRPMTPIEVRDGLAACGFDMSKYVNDLAAIHTVLKRLNETGELRLLVQDSGKPAYVYSSARSWHLLGLGAPRPASPIVLTAHRHVDTPEPKPPGSTTRRKS